MTQEQIFQGAIGTEQSSFEIWLGSAIDIWRAANPDVTVREVVDGLEYAKRKLTEDLYRYGKPQQ
jgi:hypothetical protein